MSVFFFFFIHDDVESIYKRLDERRDEITEKYGFSMPVPNLDIATIRAIDFFEYCCCDMLEDPEFFLYGGKDTTGLPESVQEYNQITDFLHNELRKRCTGIQIGERLRKARKENGLTGEKVVELWGKLLDEDGHHCTTTQASVSNHERGKVANIKLIDLLRYNVIYNKIVALDEIMFGCTYTDLLDSNKTLRIKQERACDPLENERALTGDQYIEQLRKLLIVLTDGKCERCDQIAPFYDKEGEPYLLLKTFSEGPSFENAVVLCPNCFARIETLQETEEIEMLKRKATGHSLMDLYKHTHF